MNVFGYRIEFKWMPSININWAAIWLGTLVWSAFGTFCWALGSNPEDGDKWHFSWDPSTRFWFVVAVAPSAITMTVLIVRSVNWFVHWVIENPPLQIRKIR